MNLKNFVSQLNRRVLEIPKRQAKIELYAAPADHDNNDASSIVSTGATLCAFVDALRSVVRYLAPSRIGSGVTRFNEMISPTESSRFLLKLSRIVTNRGSRRERGSFTAVTTFYNASSAKAARWKISDNFPRRSSIHGPLIDTRSTTGLLLETLWHGETIVFILLLCFFSFFFFFSSFFTARLFLLLTIKWR